MAQERRVFQAVLRQGAENLRLRSSRSGERTGSEEWIFQEGKRYAQLCYIRYLQNKTEQSEQFIDDLVSSFAERRHLFGEIVFMEWVLNGHHWEFFDDDVMELQGNTGNDYVNDIYQGRKNRLKTRQPQELRPKVKAIEKPKKKKRDGRKCKNWKKKRELHGKIEKIPHKLKTQMRGKDGKFMKKCKGPDQQRQW